MRVLLKNKILLSVIMGLVTASFMFFGVMQFYRNTGGKISLLAADTSHCSKTAVVLDTITKGIFSADVQKKLPVSTESPGKKKNRISKFLFYIVSSLLISGDKSLILLAVAFMGVLVLLQNKPLYRDEKEISVPPELKFYLWWSLRFLSPVQKCIQTLADKYDINPIYMYGRVESTRKKDPHFVVDERSAGFFIMETA